MHNNPVPIDDVSAEAFEAFYARLVITARSAKWAYEAAVKSVGCATSIIGCGCEAGIEARSETFSTPDGRPGHELLFFARTKERLKKELIKRVGQVCLPTPTVTVFSGLAKGEDFPLGEKVAMFGDSYQSGRKKFGRDLVSVPITSGEFMMEKSVKMGRGIAGANFWVFAKSYKTGLKAAEHGAEAIAEMQGLILPFAGGVVASPSRIGSAYSSLKASTQADYCPTITNNKNRKIPEGVEAIFEIVINATSLEIAKTAMKKGITAASTSGVLKIGAANFGGKLGNIDIPLRSL